MITYGRLLMHQKAFIGSMIQYSLNSLKDPENIPKDFSGEWQRARNWLEHLGHVARADEELRESLFAMYTDPQFGTVKTRELLIARLSIRFPRFADVELIDLHNSLDLIDTVLMHYKETTTNLVPRITKGSMT